MRGRSYHTELSPIIARSERVERARTSCSQPAASLISLIRDSACDTRELLVAPFPRIRPAIVVNCDLRDSAEIQSFHLTRG